MRFVSTRTPGAAVSLSEALSLGLAPDGGLFVPEALPRLAPPDEVASLPEEAARFLSPFFADDALADALDDVCREAFDFPCPLVSLGEGDTMLELFHGPTAAFKDYGARFLAACISRMDAVERTIMVATSGDTGGAVAAAFATQSGTKVWILYPEGRVSPRQEAQLTCWGDRAKALSVRGSFDDCQRIVKEAFGQPALRAQFGLTSANSINLGRILPQAAYAWYAARTHHHQTGRPMQPIIPTGNLGHGVAAVWARAMGAPIRQVVFALNRNRAVLDYLTTGKAEPREAVPTLANAMDVGVPSNLERLQHLESDHRRLRDRADAFSFGDEAVESALRRSEKDWGMVVCPHTACGLLAREALGSPGWTVFATAHPSKFEAVVEPLIGHEVPLAPSLQAILARDTAKVSVEPTLEAVISAAQA